MGRKLDYIKFFREKLEIDNLEEIDINQLLKDDFGKAYPVGTQRILKYWKAYKDSII